MQEMFESICGLSYRGDVRVGIAEDREKVKRIAQGSFEALQDLYRPNMQVRSPEIFNLLREMQLR